MHGLFEKAVMRCTLVSYAPCMNCFWLKKGLSNDSMVGVVAAVFRSSADET
jgi:hypothetical protein